MFICDIIFTETEIEMPRCKNSVKWQTIQKTDFLSGKETINNEFENKAVHDIFHSE